jgi:hypothetical protein
MRGNTNVPTSAGPRAFFNSARRLWREVTRVLVVVAVALIVVVLMGMDRLVKRREKRVWNNCLKGGSCGEEIRDQRDQGGICTRGHLGPSIKGVAAKQETHSRLPPRNTLLVPQLQMRQIQLRLES